MFPPDPPPGASAGPSTLRDRLRRLGAAGVARPGIHTAAPQPAHPHLPAGGDGIEIVRTRFAAHHRHGRCVVGHALEALAGSEGVDIATTVWLDTETTGLAGGTGTCAFLVGLAYPDGSTLVTEQLLLRRLSAERHLLASLDERMRRARHLVTFNGQRFDWPILEARFILARQRAPAPEAHTDLIYPARRLWHRILGTYRLSALEAEVLGAPREDDVPGSEIPGIYVQYLRDTDRAALDPILAHNRADLVALVLLHGEVTRILRAPRNAGVPLDWEGAGVLLARRGAHRESLECFERAVGQTEEAGPRWRILRRLARQYRLAGDPSRARARWEQEAGTWARPDRFRAHVLEEVAKVRAKRGDTEGARQAAREALAIASALGGAAPWAAGSGVAGLAERLRARLGRLEQCNGPRAAPAVSGRHGGRGTGDGTPATAWIRS